jgi:flagella basal body P-ring formation protein FlgA
MLRWFPFAALTWVLCAGIAFADPVTLRTRIEAAGPAVTLGDVFDGASAEVANRAIAPAPRPGQVSTISIPVLAAAASAAGLEWTPPPGVSEVRVIRPGGARATLPPDGGAAGGRSVADAAVRRGEMVSLVYLSPGIELTTRARALEDGAVGQSVRLQNTTSNRTIDAIVTGPSMARAVAP